MDFSYTEEQQLIQKTAGEFAQEHLAPGVIERDDKAEFPKEQLKLLGELGFMGMMIPEEWNGAGFDTISYCIAMEEICAVDALQDWQRENIGKVAFEEIGRAHV